MKNYRTVLNESETELIISKSRFIAHVKPIESEEDATLFIDKIKKKYWDATHNVPVYVIGENYNVQRYSDDGEPSGTAGGPILQMLKNEEITNVCIVVTRYFGGGKLGTGGLVRAYTHCAKDALTASVIAHKKVMQRLKIDFEYHFHGKLQNYFINEPEIIVQETRFTDNICVELYVDPQFEKKIIDQMTELTSGQIVVEQMSLDYVTV